MKKMAAAAFLVFSAVLSAQMSFAEENPAEWLIGKWEGALQDFSPKDAAGRKMKVTTVAPDGTAQGQFGGGARPGAAQIKLEGSQVKVITGMKAVVVLNRTGDDRLEGTFTWPDGRAFSIALTKVKSAPESTWACGEPASAPTYQVGDKWTWRDAKGAEWNNTVVQVEGDVAQIRRPPNNEVAFYDKDWVIQQVKRANGELITQQAPGPYSALHQKVLDFPLQVGKTWTTSIRGTEGGIPVTIPTWRKILSCEEISTPAGKLQAFKVESTLSFARGKLTLNSWYAPQAKQFVRVQYVSSQNVSWNWDATVSDNELISFDVW